MLASLAILFVAPQTYKTPILPPGCSPDFQRLVISVEQSLKDGDFEAAAKKVQLLPKENATFSWDDSKLPTGLRDVYAQSRDMAFKAWNRNLEGFFTFRPGNPADVKFGFEQRLANDPATSSPAGLATFLSETTLPRVEAVIGLTRGIENRPTNSIDVQNDVAYSLGTYLGVSSTFIPSTSMARSDSSSIVPNAVTALEMSIAKENILVVKALRDAIHARAKLDPAMPKASYDETSLTFGPVIQGQEVSIPLLITNVGQGELTYQLVPSCSCITTGPAGSLKANEARLVSVYVDTTNWTRTIDKKLMVLTNDPETPVRVVPIQVKVKPRYRWIVPGGSVRVVEDSGADIDLYLDLPEGSGIYPKEVRFDGVGGKAKMEPWSGELADPLVGEEKMPRDGYHIKLHVSGVIYGDRQTGVLTVITSNEQFPQITFNFWFQKGILAEPSNINLGMISSASGTFSTTLARPGKPFRVLSTSTSSKFLSSRFIKIAGTDDYRVEVGIVGKPPTGDYAAVVHVYTDDPRQAKMDILVRGTVE
jgi:hypothetical protein